MLNKSARSRPSSDTSTRPQKCTTCRHNRKSVQYNISLVLVPAQGILEVGVQGLECRVQSRVRTRAGC